MPPDILHSREPEDVIIARRGAVLGIKTTLKSDHFPGCQNKRLQPHVEGAPNFRQAGDLPVYGVAIPTAQGIRNVLNLVGAYKKGGRRVIWHNMREEPVLYINGRPFVLREVERPFTNLEYTGIDRERVEGMEARLKQDVLEEASRYGNKIMVSDELPDGQMVDQWEPIGPESAQTPLEVYQSLQEEGYPVEYERIPVTDEKSPKERDFDLLVQRLGREGEDVAQVFNCQMGRGRTTTGMVAATLIHLMKTNPSAGAPNGVTDGENTSPQVLSGSPADDEEALRRGEYPVIRSLTRVLKGGVESKRQVDKVIDTCSAMQNLREAILGYRNSIQRQADEKKREAALSLFVEYLERYYFLICFAVYIRTDPLALKPRLPGGEGGFQFWMKTRPELYSVLRRLLRRDPMGALGFAAANGKVRRSASGVNGKAWDMEAVLNSRSGEVLGRQTMLKGDHCPGCQNMNLPEHIEGAPNFREVSGFPVYGVANPTVAGIKKVLARVGGAPGGRLVLWHNMREEPMVYVNGKPFVLREVERPFNNMLEYTGIERERIEQMEARLKEDVLTEAKRYDGALMVNHETDAGEIFDAWEPVSLEGNHVQTPAEVYQGLQNEGYKVEYARVPITDGKAPKSRDFAAIAANISACGPNTALVFNCQMGRGRTTTGTVIACLVLTRCSYGRPLVSLLPQLFPQRESSSSGDDSPNGQEAAPSFRSLDPAPAGSAQPGHDDAAGDRPGPLNGQEADAQDQQPSIFEIHRQRVSKQPRFAPWGHGSENGLNLLHSMQTEPLVDQGTNVEQRGRGSGAPDGEVAVLGEARPLPGNVQLVYRRGGEHGQGEAREAERHGTEQFSMDDVAIVRKITRLLERGAECRQVLDTVIDRCAAMQNIRQAILRYRRAFNHQDENARVRERALSRGMEYLERYYMLIVFTAYLDSDSFRPGPQWGPQGGAGGAEALTFKAWIRRRPEIRQMKWSMRLRPARLFTIPEVEKKAAGDTEEQDAVMDAVVKARSGQVLGRCSILKMYIFPGLEANERTPFPGAPNVNHVEGFPVHSMATPTMEGARAVLALLGAAPAHVSAAPDSAHGPPGARTGLLSAPDGSSRRKAIVTDLREEAVVYVHGQPYVLRELDQPASTLKHVGIEGPVVEQLEQRLKEDILAEAAHGGGRILLHKESGDVNTGSGQPNIVGHWETVTPQDVVTPADMYAALQTEGYNVDYRRIPVTRERVPKASDVDAIQQRADGAGRHADFLFISHTGYGGVAYAMAITCLRLHAQAHISSAATSSSAQSPAAPSPASDFSFVLSPSTPPRPATQEDPETRIAVGSVRARTPMNGTAAAPSPAPAGSSPGGTALSPKHSLPAVNPLPSTPFPPGAPPPSPRTAVRGVYAEPIAAADAAASPQKKAKADPQEIAAAMRNGDYRDVLSLERVLVHGPASKFEVDTVLDRLRDAGNLREDIWEHRQAALACGEGQAELKAAQVEKGVQALRRYCYLIVFRAYLYARVAERGTTYAGNSAFAAWMEQRPELGHMCERLKLI